jgi:aminopeptidase N
MNTPDPKRRAHAGVSGRSLGCARSSIAVSFAALTSLATGCGDPATPITGTVDASITHYDYRIDLATGVASVVVTATVITQGDCWSVPFRAQNLTNATWNGAPAGGGLNGGMLQLCGDGVEAGATLQVAATMKIASATLSDSQVGFSTKVDREGHPFTYLVSWVNGCDQFGPCDSRPDKFATYKFTVAHTADVKVRCAGIVTETSPIETICDFNYPGGPTYSTFGIVATNGWTVTQRGMWGPLNVTLYDRPSTKIDSKIDSAYQSEYINWMISQFGPFPYGNELRILTGPTYWSGFEHPGNIVLADYVATQLRPAYADNTQHILDHEIAHQWAGDQTTLKDTYDFVWKESMAEYITYVFEDKKSAAIAAVTAGAWKSFSSGAKFFPVPGEKPKLFDYYGDVYGPGPMIMFRQIETLSSRAKVLAALATLLGKPRAISVDDVIAALQASTGLDLTAYTAAWIKGSGKPQWPLYSAVFTPGPAAGQPGSLAVTLTNVAESKGQLCAFHIELKGANPGNSVKVLVDTFRNGASQTLNVTTPAFVVTSTVVDPDSECLVFTAATVAPVQRHNPWLAGP